MAGLRYVTTHYAGALSSGARVTDFTAAATATGTFLYAGAQRLSDLMSFRLDPGQAATYSDSRPLGTGSQDFARTELDVLQVNGQTTLLPAARFGADLGGPALNDDGTFGPARMYPDGSAGAAGLVTLEVIGLASGTWVYGAVPGVSGVMSWRVSPSGTSLAPQPLFADTVETFAAEIRATASCTIGGESWLFVASPAEHGVSAFRVASDGQLLVAGAMGARDGIGINTPTAIEAITVGGTGYLVVASAGSSSLSVLRVEGGSLIPTDHVTDSLLTRFQSVEALETFSVAGRAYVVAGGGDDGLSLFELLPDGRLIAITTLADTAAMALANVAAIEAVAVGGVVQVFVSSGNDDGITQFDFVPGAAGLTLAGTIGADTLTGSAADDIVMGGRGDDLMVGSGGADILVDGAGSDTLWGGSGNDIFVLIEDAGSDVIAELDPRFDRLDLSDFALLHGVSQITITPTVTGAVLTYAGERVEIISASGGTLLAPEFSTANTLNLPRSPVQAIRNARIEPGTAGHDAIAGSIFPDTLRGYDGNDTLSGGMGDDTLDGGGGADVLVGSAGFDLAEYVNALTFVVVDLAAPGPTGSTAARDRKSVV